ncbi:MAG: ATP-dependent Clp protease proteolytic subunit [Spirochaetaceae bacterium]|nr:ATP-dependent Clp protease proteolytic subunit [Spirochaetaceae bacterium]
MEESKEDKGDSLNNKLMKTRSVLLFGEVNKVLGEKIIKQLLILDKDGSEPITVYIDSPGGDIDAGFAIFDTLRFINSPISCVVMGLAASMGAMILLAAGPDKRFGFPNSRYLIHQPLISGTLKGVATEIEIHANEMQKYRHKINEIIAKECNKELTQVEKDTDRDHWFSAEEAINYGLISRIINHKKEL